MFFRKSPCLPGICTEVFTDGMIPGISLKIVQWWRMREDRGEARDKAGFATCQSWLTLGAGYMEVHYIFLLTFTCILNFL